MEFLSQFLPFLVLLAGIAFIVLAIVAWKMHPFLALILAAVLVGLLSPRPLIEGEVADARAKLEKSLRADVEAGRITEEDLENRLAGAAWDVERGKKLPAAILALELTASGFGATAGGIGIVIVLAAVIGQCLMESGAADRITRKFLAILGEARANLALLGSGYLLSVPVFFDTVFFLLVPLARSLRLRTGRSYVLYVMAICAGGAITHSLVPPTPGPLIMVENLPGLDLGWAIGAGFLIGLLPAVIGGILYSGYVDRRLDIPLREVTGSSQAELEEIVRRPDHELPGFTVSVLPVVLPVVLITGHSIVEALEKGGESPVLTAIAPWTGFLGNKNFALLVATFIAAWVLVRQKGLTLARLREKLEPAVMSAGIIILITAAGGAFGKMLSRIGIDEALRQMSGGESGGGLLYIALAWGIAAVMKIAQGSGTVSMITTSGIMAAVIGDQPLPYDMIYIFSAIGFGSLFISWMNDSGFWVVCKLSGFTERETLGTWTLLLAVIGVVGLVEVLILSSLLPLV